MADSNTKSPRRRSHLRRVVVIGWFVITTATTLLVLAVLIMAAVFNARGRATRQRLNDELTRRGIATQLPVPGKIDWDSSPEPQQSGTAMLDAAMALADTNLLPVEMKDSLPIVWIADGPGLTEQVHPDQLAVIEHYLELVQPALILQTTAVELGHIALDLDLSIGVMESQGVSTLSGLRRLARLNQVDALAASAHTDAARVADALQRNSQLSALLDHNQFILTRLVAISLDALSFSAIEECLSRVEISADDIRQLQDLVTSRERATRPLDMLASEMTFANHFVQHPDLTSNKKDLQAQLFASFRQENSVTIISVGRQRHNGWAYRLERMWYVLSPGYVSNQQAPQIDLLLQMYDAAKPAASLLEALDHIERVSETEKPDPAAMQDLNVPASVMRQHVALVHVTLAGLDAERYRLEHGHWPHRVSDLRADLPEDPYSGKALLATHHERGLVLYSVGPNGVDDGGNQTKGMTDRDADIVFRLFNPDQRNAGEPTYWQHYLDRKRQEAEIENMPWINPP